MVFIVFNLGILGDCNQLSTCKKNSCLPVFFLCLSVDPNLWSSGAWLELVPPKGLVGIGPSYPLPKLIRRLHTGPSPEKWCFFLIREMGPRLVQGNLGWWNIIEEIQEMQKLLVNWRDFPCFFCVLFGLVSINDPCSSIWLPRTQMTSIFKGQPSKTRPFPIKTRVIWVLGCSRYIYIHWVYACPKLGDPTWWRWNGDVIFYRSI